MRNKDKEFREAWERQVKLMRKTYTRNFPLYESGPNAEQTVSTFFGLTADFGDHLLFKTVMSAPENMRCVFSNDADFYSFPDDLYLLTTNGQIIRTADKGGKLY